MGFNSGFKGLNNTARIDDYCLMSLQNAGYLALASLQPHVPARAPCCFYVFAPYYEMRRLSYMR